MDWKNTVLDRRKRDREAKRGYGKYRAKLNNHPLNGETEQGRQAFACKAVAETQAKVSFPAGARYIIEWIDKNMEKKASYVDLHVTRKWGEIPLQAWEDFKESIA